MRQVISESYKLQISLKSLYDRHPVSPANQVQLLQYQLQRPGELCLGEKMYTPGRRHAQQLYGMRESQTLAGKEVLIGDHY